MSLLLFVSFFIFIIQDYYLYNESFSAPFETYIFIRCIEFILPSIIMFIIGRILSKSNDKFIVINDEVEYKSFLKKIFFYKSFIFYNTIFILKGSYDNYFLSRIVKALNIKDRKKRVSYLYDEIVKYVDDYYPSTICDFKNNQCFWQRESKSNKFMGCCRGCKLVRMNKGCESSNISCKLTFCRPARKKIKKLKLRDIDLVRFFGLSRRIIIKNDYFSKREDVINDLYYGIVLWLIRAFVKGIKVTFRRT